MMILSRSFPGRDCRDVSIPLHRAWASRPRPVVVRVTVPRRVAKATAPATLHTHVHGLNGDMSSVAMERDRDRETRQQEEEDREEREERHHRRRNEKECTEQDRHRMWVGCVRHFKSSNDATSEKCVRSDPRHVCMQMLKNHANCNEQQAVTNR